MEHHMTAHQAKIFVLAGPLRSVIECSCGEYEKTKQGSGPDIDERLLRDHAKHATYEPPSTGVEVDKTEAGCSFQSTDEGQTGWVACHDGKPPNDGDYLILPNGDLGNAATRC
jgi:hypothetical protein